MSFLFNEWVMIPLFGICVFILVLLWADKGIAWLHKKSLGKREEIIRLLQLMGMDVEKRKVTAAMLLMSFGLGP